MNGVDTRRYEMLARVHDFYSAHTDLFPASSVGAQAFAAVASAVDELSDKAATQFSGRGSAREGTTSKAVAREALREDLDAISRTARALAVSMPGLDDKFRLPRSNGDQALLSAARAFAHDALPIANDFVAHEMSKDFLDELNASIKEFEEAMHHHEAGKDVHVAARAGIDSALESGLAAVRVLDAIVPNRLRNDSATMAVWERARHVEYPAARVKSETPAPTTSPNAPAAPATT